MKRLKTELNECNLKDIMTGTGFRVTEKAEFHSLEQVCVWLVEKSFGEANPADISKGESEPLQLRQVPCALTLP